MSTLNILSETCSGTMAEGVSLKVAKARMMPVLLLSLLKFVCKCQCDLITKHGLVTYIIFYFDVKPL